jgi:hypothetical protein
MTKHYPPEGHRLSRPTLRDKWWLTLSLPLLGGIVAAQTTSGDAVRLRPFEEYHVSEIKAGGHALVGATTADDSPNFLLRPALFIPESIYGKSDALCVETFVVDGTYSSHGELRREDVVARHGVLRYQFPDGDSPDATRYAEEIRKLDAAVVAPLITLGHCHSEENRNNHIVIVADRSNGSRGEKDFRLYVNPGIADEVVARYKGRSGAQQEARCMPPRTQRELTTFSLICELSGPFAPLTHVDLDLRHFSRQLPVQGFDLVYAPAT